MKNLIKVSLVIAAIGVAVKIGKEIKKLKLKVEAQNGRIVTLEQQIEKLDYKINFRKEVILNDRPLQSLALEEDHLNV